MNQFLREVPFEAGGKVYALRLTMHGLRMLERKRSTNVHKVMAELQTGEASIDLLADVLWAAMQENDPPPSERDVSRLLDTVPLRFVGPVVGEVLMAFVEAQGAEQAARPRKGPRLNGTGRNSSRSSSVPASTPKSSGG